MAIAEFDRPPSWSLDASKTGERTKCPWVRGEGVILFLLVCTVVVPSFKTTASIFPEISFIPF